MSAAQDLITDTILDALDRGPRRCPDCFLVINLCECNDPCEDPDCDCCEHEETPTWTVQQYP